jgi:DNA polymerase-3 subunit epsilon
VRVEDGKTIDTFSQLIKPPVLHFEFTYIHGISEGDVVDDPRYDEVHDDVMKRIDGAGFIAAHNAAFDSSVMIPLCRHWAVESNPC